VRARRGTTRKPYVAAAADPIPLRVICTNDEEIHAPRRIRPRRRRRNLQYTCSNMMSVLFYTSVDSAAAMIDDRND